MKTFKNWLYGVCTAVIMISFTAAPAMADTSTAQACWGQASKVFAQTGQLGKHASEQPTPRLGLGNLARALYEAGLIADDSIASLGGYVAAELGLSIDACLAMPAP